jgi:hypothetical protein
VDRESFDFGVIDVNVTGRHEFVVTNAGEQPLTLARGRTTCGCCTCVCTARLPDPASIAPGRSEKATLQWVSKAYSGPFRASVTLVTNDPERPEVTLWVVGRLGAAVRAVPPKLGLGRLVPGGSASGAVRVYAYSKEPLQITAWQWVDPTAAKHFEVAVDPLGAEQLREEAGANGGYQVRVTAKPGLSENALRQQVALKTNVPSVPVVTIPLEETVGSEVAVAGPGWDAASGVLSLGTTRQGQAGSWSVFLLVRGPLAERLKAKLVRVAPEWLKVELGESKPTADPSVRQVPLTVRIPAASAQAVSLGPEEASLGRIVLETSHPDVPRLHIRVRLTVEK